MRPPIEMMGPLRLLLLALGLLLVNGLSAQAEAQTLTIVSGSKRHVFKVELVDTPETRAKGLMFRREIASDYGMLFDFGRDEDIQMWMKNTYVSLDMLFIRKDGTIHHIAENAVPFSTDTISSNGPVRSVLEVAGGTAKRLDLKPGDRVEHPLFRK